MKQSESSIQGESLRRPQRAAIVVDGKLAGCCAGRGPDEHVLRSAFLGVEPTPS